MFRRMKIASRRGVQAALRLMALITFGALAMPLAAAPDQPAAAGRLQDAAIRYQFAIYYPDAPAKPPIDALRARLSRMTAPPKLVARISIPPKRAMIAATLNLKAQQEYAPPRPSQVHYFGRGLTTAQAEGLQRARQALILDFGHPAKASMSAYRASLVIAEQVARDTGGLLWDEETREIFTVDEWHKRRLESWQGDLPDVSQQTIIHAYQGDGQLVRSISLGMGKFGLPDVVIARFPWSSTDRMGWLLNAFLQGLVEGAPSGAQGRFELDFRAIRHDRLRQRLLEQASPKGSGKAALLVVTTPMEQGDPQNRLLALRFDRAAGKDEGSRQDSLLAGLFGSTEGKVAWIRDGGATLAAASKAAKAKLPALREAFNRGLRPGEYILVKAPFRLANGGTEWMWVEVSAWSGDVITGLLKNEPANIPSLHAGQQVTVSQRELFDYSRHFPDGRIEGNETSKIIERLR